MLTELLYYALAIARTAASSIQGSDGIVPYIGNTSRTPGTESATQLNQHRVSDFPARWPPWFRFLLVFGVFCAFRSLEPKNQETSSRSL